MQPAAQTRTFYIQHLQKYSKDSPDTPYVSLVEWLPDTGIAIKGFGESCTLESTYKPDLSKLVLVRASTVSLKAQDAMVTGMAVQGDSHLDTTTDIASSVWDFCAIKNINSEVLLTYQIIATEESI